MLEGLRPVGRLFRWEGVVSSLLPTYAARFPVMLQCYNIASSNTVIVSAGNYGPRRLGLEIPPAAVETGVLATKPPERTQK